MFRSLLGNLAWPISFGMMDGDSLLSPARRSALSWWLTRIAAVMLVAGGLGGWQLSVQDHRRREDAAALRLDGALGATVEPLDEDIAADLGLPIESRGLVLTSLAADGRSARAGLRPGDVIEEIGDRAIDDPLSAARALEAEHGTAVQLIVNRHGHASQVLLDGRLSAQAAQSAR